MKEESFAYDIAILINGQFYRTVSDTLNLYEHLDFGHLGYCSTYVSENLSSPSSG
jgi:hypothetical protein